MFVVNQGKPQDLGGALPAPLSLTGARKVICWLRDEWWRAAVIRELDRLNDHYLEDIGIKRSDIGPLVDTMVRRRRERRSNPSCTYGDGGMHSYASPALLSWSSKRFSRF